MYAREVMVKEEIKSVARKLFQVHGIGKTTMEDIAADMGKARKYAYYYFKNKEHIFCAVAEDELHRIFDHTETLMAKKESIADKLEVFFRAYHLEAKKTIALYPLLASDLPHFLPTIKAYTEKANERFRERLEKLFRQGIATGEFKSMKSSDCRMMALASMRLLQGMDVRILMSVPLTNEEDSCNVLMRTFIRGLR
ncbi:MAG: TetR/AcrR family transcriptional regulator [Elusimicrobiaceae bacterium]